MKIKILIIICCCFLVSCFFEDEDRDQFGFTFTALNKSGVEHENVRITIGGMENGYFSKDHGKMTDKLAHMFIKLCERYATRSNWRGYTYNEEMRGTALLQLSQIGLQFNEDKSQNPFAYYTAAITNSFTRVLNLEKKGQRIRDDILEQNGLNPSYTRQNENDEKMKVLAELHDTTPAETTTIEVKQKK